MAILATGLTLEQFLSGYAGEFSGFLLAVLIHTLLLFHVFAVSPVFLSGSNEKFPDEFKIVWGRQE